MDDSRKAKLKTTLEGRPSVYSLARLVGRELRPRAEQMVALSEAITGVTQRNAAALDAVAQKVIDLGAPEQQREAIARLVATMALQRTSLRGDAIDPRIVPRVTGISGESIIKFIRYLHSLSSERPKACTGEGSPREG